MSDIALGPGFEAPDYGDILDRMKQSGRPELEKVSQILATAQMVHSTLSGFEDYKNLADTLSKSAFDPIKQQLTASLDETSKTLGNLVNAGNNNLPGVSADLLKTVKSPEDLLKAGRNLVGDIKTGGKGLLKGAKQKLNKVVKQAEQATEDIKQGKVPKLSLEAGEGNDVSDLFKSGLADILPDLPGIENLPQALDPIAQTAKSALQTVSESQSILKTMPDALNAALDKQLGKLPTETLNNLRTAGLSDADIKTNLLTPQKLRQYTDIDYENPLRNMRMMQFDEPELFGADFDPKTFIKRYNTKFGNAPEVNSGKGLLKGDTDVSTKIQKGALNKTPQEAQQEISDAGKIDSTPVKLSKRALKQRAKASRTQEEAGPAEEQIQQPKPQEQIQQQQQQIKVQPQEQPSEIEPADSELSEEAINTDSKVASDAFNADSLISQQVNKVSTTLQDTANTVSDGIEKAKSLLSKATLDTSELDETPIGDLINGALGLATIGTMIAGLFDPSTPQPTIVSGEQIGV